MWEAAWFKILARAAIIRIAVYFKRGLVYFYSVVPVIK